MRMAQEKQGQSGIVHDAKGSSLCSAGPQQESSTFEANAAEAVKTSPLKEMESSTRRKTATA